MIAATVRSGLVESTHSWSAVLVADGKVGRTWGDDVTRPVFARSTIKPLQAALSQEWGADLVPEHLAVAAASHTATPVHVSIVAAMLAGVSLSADALGCPPALPMNTSSRERWLAAGRSAAPIAHNCSGKHAAFLRASVARDWDPATYLDPAHPLQRKVVDLVAETTGEQPLPLGVDGCGAPTPRVSLTDLANAFAAISRDPFFAEVATAMTRYPALTADNQRADGRLAAWWPGPAKVGAEGLMALGRDGMGLAVKSWEGSIQIAVVGVIEALRSSGMLQPHQIEALAEVARPAVYGGGRRVGCIAPDITQLETEEA